MNAIMKLIIGLGNPGEQYKNNRHNVGHMVVDVMTYKVEPLKVDQKKGSTLLVRKSNCFMNDSGSFVKHFISLPRSGKLRLYPNISMSDLYIIHDDLDIRLGEYKIQFGKGPKGHNGILDIEEKLGTSEFWRVRVGIENRNPEDRKSGEEYVLDDFTDSEIPILGKVIKEICKKLE